MYEMKQPRPFAENYQIQRGGGGGVGGGVA